MNDIETILRTLVQFESITPHDLGCQTWIIDYLTSLGFTCQRFDNPPVSNFFARFGSSAPLLLFAGHTDVVPVGDQSKWLSDPFTLTQQNGLLYGRGTADMKGSIAAMLIAAKRFVEAHHQGAGSLAFLITSGEEGDYFNQGTPYVMSQLLQQGITTDYCIVGEPSSEAALGDVIKVGRRGSLTGKLILQGKQGHVAYPHLAINPIHQITPALAEIAAIVWDAGNAHFPPTSLQITHIQAGGQANNIIPGDVTVHFNVRFSTEQTASSLKNTLQACFDRYDLYPNIDWTLNGEPFLTTQGKLLSHCIDSIKRHTGKSPTLSTSGGTSDGRFIAPYGVEVVELGPINATIHQVNECVSLADLETLSAIYLSLCEGLLF